MTDTIRVRLRKPPRVFTFLGNNIELSRDESCVVKTDRGLEFGVCVEPPQPATEGEMNRYKMSVLRRASHHDSTTYKQIQHDEARAMTVCRDKIKSRNLPMRLVEAEYTFDRKKIIFYFTAEDRVDFRELVKDLAQDLKTRIELRHIQVRDQAKMTGGIGTCGRELCCTTWMREFLPISMKMAKRQNLSLNPTKISGQCGRLMCCLAYENELYESERRRSKPAPKAAPADLREEMESNQKQAVQAIARSEETDVLEDAAPSKDAKPDQQPSSAEGDQKPKRRRRGRRGGRGRSKKPN